MSYSDPYVPGVRIDGGEELPASEPDGALSEADCVVIVTDHKVFDYKAVVEKARLIVDTRNALKGIESDKIVRL